jgi:hypothetical protein
MFDPKATASHLDSTDAVEKVFLHRQTQIFRAIGAAILQMCGEKHPKAMKLAGDFGSLPEDI